MSIGVEVGVERTKSAMLAMASALGWPLAKDGAENVTREGEVCTRSLEEGFAGQIEVGVGLIKASIEITLDGAMMVIHVQAGTSYFGRQQVSSEPQTHISINRVSGDASRIGAFAALLLSWAGRAQDAQEALRPFAECDEEMRAEGCAALSAWFKNHPGEVMEAIAAKREAL